MNDSLHFVQNLKMCESSFHATMQDKMFVNGNKNLSELCIQPDLL